MKNSRPVTGFESMWHSNRILLPRRTFRTTPYRSSRLDGLTPDLASQLEELVPVQLVQPGQSLLYLDSMDPAASDMRDVRRFAGQDRRAREIPVISADRDLGDIFLPASGKLIGYIKWRHAWSHAAIQQHGKPPLKVVSCRFVRKRGHTVYPR